MQLRLVYLLSFALAALGSTAGNAIAAESARMDTFVSPSGDAGYFALSLSPNVAQPKSAGHDVVLLVDTSASQTGIYRTRTLESLAALCQALSPNDRVKLWAVDTNAVALTAGFVPPNGPELAAALRQLENRVPLGTTDMDAALAAILSSYPDKRTAGRARAAVYLGDGLSPTHVITSERLAEFARRFTAAQIAVTCFGIGPRIDGLLMGALANITGGLIFTDDEEVSPHSVGQQLADIARGWVVWTKELNLSNGFEPVYHDGARPLRFDRNTVLVGTFRPEKQLAKPIDVHLSGALAGKAIELNWKVTPGAPNDDQAYLAQLVEFARRDAGVSLATAGDAALDQVRRLAVAGAHGLARLGRQAAITGDFNSAAKIADLAANIDPSDQDALVLRRAAAGKASVMKRASFAPAPADADAGPAPARAAEAPSVDAPPPQREADDGDLLSDVEQQERVTQGFLRAEVRNALNEARSRMAADPEGVSNMLKLLMDKVRHISEASPELRAQLADQIEAALRATNRQAVVQGEKDLERQQILAEGEARERINRELFLQQQKVDQLMARFNALMDQERFRDAEALADIAEEMQPGSPGLRGAELTARMVGWTADMTQIRDMRHKGFVDATMQIELSHVPTADEPPILYPDPEVWQMLTERRKKYKAVDLTQHGPNETKILAALDEKTELDFADQPLQDVVDYLKQYHGIEIQLDNKALTDAGVGSDTPVTRTIKGITLRSALKLILSEFDLTYVIRNEVLMITSKTEAESMLSTRVYPVADLVVPITNPIMSMGGRGRF